MLSFLGIVLLTVLGTAVCDFEKPVSYSGHRVLSVVPKTHDELRVLSNLRRDYGVDLWNEPKNANQPVMLRLEPRLVDSVLNYLVKNNIEYSTAFEDLQSIIDQERVQHAPPTNATAAAGSFDFGQYHILTEVVDFVQKIANSYSNIAKLEIAGTSYENRPIYNLRISNGEFGSKPVIMIECGIHAREWSSVAAGLYLINELVSGYQNNAEITALLNKYEFSIIPEANPDGYLYTWSVDRLWRKTRSRSNMDWLGNCRGADANRNFDIYHCGVGTSRKPCDDTYCGDSAFSESESRTIRDLMNRHGGNLKAYFTLHAFSQYWMTPYGYTKALPPDYNELIRVGSAGVNAIARRYGTVYTIGSIANIIYEASSSSVDYAYAVKGIKMAFALELRDKGRYGFFLPRQDILPMCEETFDGLKAAIQAL